MFAAIKICSLAFPIAYVSGEIKKKGKEYILLTNAPRPNNVVKNFLRKMGMDENFEDAEVLYGQYHRDQIFNIEPDAVALRQVDVTAHQLQKKISDVMKQTIFGPSKIRESFLTVGASVDAVSIKDIKICKR